MLEGCSTNVEKKQHEPWPGWKEPGPQTVLLINCLLFSVKTLDSCPPYGGFGRPALQTLPPSINGLPLILVQREVKGLMRCTSPQDGRQHWLQNAARSKSVVLILSGLWHLHKRLPPADSESHVVTLYTAHATSSEGSGGDQSASERAMTPGVRHGC